ncbi:MAG: hypothetical protein Q4B90_05010 [Eubacteriales bacterium]|nr:hypothetical protein [Eubacteriales bacterium]
MAEDIIVADENFQMASEMIRKYGEFLNLHLGAYEWILNQVINSAVQDEQITEKLQNILENVNGIKEVIKSTAEVIGQQSVSFVEAIDEADKFLYGNR